MRPFTVLHLFDGMIMAVVDDDFFFHFRMGYIIYQCPTDTAAVAGIDEIILRTGVQGIFTVYKFRVQNDIALLAFGNQIRQSLPVLQIFGTHDTRFGYGRRQVAGGGVRVKAFAAKDTVNPTVIMGCQAHIIHVRLFRI